jgi:ankyrin repeat protein
MINKFWACVSFFLWVRFSVTLINPRLTGMDVVAVPPLSSLPIDIATAIFKWIPPWSIDACLLRQTNTLVKHILTNRMGWPPLLDPYMPFTHDLRVIIDYLPKRSPTDIDALSITVLKRGQFENFVCLNGKEKIMSDHVIAPIKYNHFDCVKQLLGACRDNQLEEVYDAILLESARRGNMEIFTYAAALRTSNLPISGQVVVAACKHGHLKMVKYLHFTMGLDMHALDDLSIQAACYRGHLPIVQFLQSIGCDVTGNRYRPLLSAAEHGDIDLVRHLFSAQTDAETINKSIIEAAIGSNLDVVTYLHSLNVTTSGTLNDAFQKACQVNSLKLVKFLISVGANIHKNEDFGIRTASSRGQLEMVMFLCSLGATVDTRSGEPIRMACQNGHFAVVKVLHSYGADLLCEHNAPIRLASESGHLPIVRYLHANGANVRVLQNTALRQAAKHGHIEVVQFIHSLGVNEMDCIGALQKAVEYGRLAVVKYLHSVSVDIHYYAEGALRLACRNEHLDVAMFLLSVGANVRLALEYAKTDMSSDCTTLAKFAESVSSD